MMTPLTRRWLWFGMLYALSLILYAVGIAVLRILVRLVVQRT